MSSQQTGLSWSFYTIVISLMGAGQWFCERFNPDQNATFWLAAAIGSLVLRLLVPGTPVLQSLSGWFIGFVFACLTARTAIKAHWFWEWEPELVWGTLGFLGDAGLQLLSIVLDIVRNLLSYVREKPGEAFDEGLTRGERFLAVYTKIRGSLWEFVGDFFKKKPTNPS